MTTRFTSRVKLPAILLASVVLLLPTLAQALELGRISMVRKSAPALMQTVNSSPRFFRAVGGVAFSQVATPRDGLRVLDLDYTPAQPDGRRLRVRLRTKDGKTVTVAPSLPDWQLLPLVRFAASKYESCVTLFGSLSSEDEARAARISGQRIVNYHPALDNTLLGLRLLQADMLVLTEDAAELPKEDGKYLLGVGERRPRLKANTKRYQRVREWLDAQDEQFSSYVIGDAGKSIQFGLVKGNLHFSGVPYWQAWRNSPEDQRKIEAIQRTLIAEMLTDASKMSEAQLEAKYTRKYIEGRTTELMRAVGVDGDVGVEQLPELSENLSKRIREQKGINPAVYDALTRTMHWSAFFRHVKQERAEAFAKLLRQVEKARPSGAIDTPTLVGFQR